MSNDLVTLLSQNPALIETGLDEDTLAVSGGRGGMKRISIKGGVFRKYSGGKEVGKIEDRHMNVIFVKMAHKPSRMFYDKGYKEGERVSPACWSSNSETPDEGVKNPVASSCAICPNSVKGSGENGTSTRCKLSWRTAVVLPNDPAGDVMQLVLPATSSFGKEDNGKFPFRPYVQHLASYNISAGRVITRMAFDTNSPTPKVLFSVAGAVPDDDKDTIARQAKSSAAESAVKMNVYQADTSEDKAVEGDAEEAADVPEPTKREASPTFTSSDSKNVDMGSVMKKWAKKKE
jgi:hypothetical protein